MIISLKPFIYMDHLFWHKKPFYLEIPIKNLAYHHPTKSSNTMIYLHLYYHWIILSVLSVFGLLFFYLKASYYLLCDYCPNLNLIIFIFHFLHLHRYFLCFFIILNLFFLLGLKYYWGNCLITMNYQILHILKLF